MPDIIGNNVGLGWGWDDGEDGWGPDMNRNLLLLDALVQGVAKSRTTTAPPLFPTQADIYVVPAGASGIWAGEADKVTVYETYGTPGWFFVQPKSGWRLWVSDEAVFIRYNGVAWVNESAGPVGGGIFGYSTVAAMQADSAPAIGSTGAVFDDPDPANNFPRVAWLRQAGPPNWHKGYDNLGPIISRIDTLVTNIQNRFPDPEGLGDGAAIFEATQGFDGVEPIISFTASGVTATYNIPAKGEFAPGNTVYFSGERFSDIIGAPTAFSAFVRIAAYDDNGAVVGSLTDCQSESPSVAGAYQGFTISRVIPASAMLSFVLGSGTTGTLKKFRTRSISIYSSASLTERGRPRTRTRKVFTSTALGSKIADLDGPVWRSRQDGKIVSLAVGPCTTAGVKHLVSFRNAVSMSSTLAQVKDQNNVLNFLPAPGTLPSIREKGGYVSAAATGRMQMDNIGTLTAKLLSMTKVPSSAINPSPSGGFASTGLAKIPAGASSFAGCWVVGNHGRPTDSSPDPNSKAGVIILSNDFRDKIADYDQTATTGNGSIQGVAVRTTGGVSTIWYVDKTAKLARELTLLGVLTGNTVNLAAITPNGMAYDAANDALWVTNEGVAEARLYSCSTGTQITTTVIPANTDQIFYDGSYLWVSYGNNGSNGTVDCRDPETNNLMQRWNNLENCQAIEGIWVETTGAGTVLYCVNDGGFHTIAKPAFNLALSYLIKAPPPRFNTDDLAVTVVLRTTGTPSQTCYVIGEGSPLDVVYNGWAVAIISATTVRFQVKTQSDVATVSVDFVVPGLMNLTKFHTITFLASRTTGTVRCWSDGVELVAVGSAVMSIARKLGTNRITLCGLIGSSERRLEATDVALVAWGDNYDRAAVATYAELETIGANR